MNMTSPPSTAKHSFLFTIRIPAQSHRSLTQSIWPARAQQFKTKFSERKSKKLAMRRYEKWRHYIVASPTMVPWICLIYIHTHIYIYTPCSITLMVPGTSVYQCLHPAKKQSWWGKQLSTLSNNILLECQLKVLIGTSVNDCKTKTTLQPGIQVSSSGHSLIVPHELTPDSLHLSNDWVFDITVRVPAWNS